MINRVKQLDLEIMFGEMFEKCKDGEDLDDMLEQLKDIIEFISDEVREEMGWE